MDLRLKSDRVICIAGPSQCGKTQFVLKLLDNRHEVFTSPINKVLWCYGIPDGQLQQCLLEKRYSAHRGLPNETNIERNSICVLDDLLTESESSKDVTNMCTRLAHHKSCVIILIVQNLFPAGKESRTRSLNTHYYVIFKNPRDKLQLETFARQIDPHKSKNLISAYEDATKVPHGYLFIDFTQDCPDNLRYRTHVLCPPITVYKLL